MSLAPEKVQVLNDAAHSGNGATAKDVLKSGEKDHLNNFSIRTNGSFCPVFCDFYDQTEIKSNGLNLAVSDFTCNLQVSILRPRRQEEITVLMNPTLTSGLRQRLLRGQLPGSEETNLFQVLNHPEALLLLGEGNLWLPPPNTQP